MSIQFLCGGWRFATLILACPSRPSQEFCKIQFVWNSGIWCDIIILWGHTVDGKHPAPLMMPEKGLILDIKMDLGHPKQIGRAHV